MLCPFCKEEIADGAIKCKHCGSMLSAPEQTAHKPQTIPEIISGGFNLQVQHPQS